MSALTSDCLPRDAAGVSPKNAGRDVLLMGIGAAIPAILVPTPAGHLLDILNDCSSEVDQRSGSYDGGSDGGSSQAGVAAAKAMVCGSHAGYALYFVVGAAFMALSCLVLMKVNPPPRATSADVAGEKQDAGAVAVSDVRRRGHVQ